MSVRATNRFLLWTAVALWATAPLVGAQTPPSVTDAEKFTPLHRAATAGDPGRIGKLAADGADLNAHDPHGRTPLLVAAFARSLPAATALIEAGAKLDLLENDRYDALTISAVIDDPALALATGRGYAAIIEILKRAGAKP